jgi:hypothetical protein
MPVLCDPARDQRTRACIPVLLAQITPALEAIVLTCGEPLRQ